MFKLKKHKDQRVQTEIDKKWAHTSSTGHASSNKERIVIHCCCSLSPETFEQLVRGSRIPFASWYKALWLVQHDYQIRTGELATQLDLSWPTAQTVRRRILHLLTTHRLEER